MTKEETVARIIDPDAFSPSMSHADGCPDCDYNRGLARLKARAAIAAADKWDAEQRATTCKHPRALADVCTGQNAITVWSCPDCGASYDSRKGNQVSPGLDSAIQDELDHPPASIMEEGK